MIPEDQTKLQKMMYCTAATQALANQYKCMLVNRLLHVRGIIKKVECDSLSHIGNLTYNVLYKTKSEIIMSLTN